MTTRDEHVAWCKQRALAYVDAGELRDALASVGSDLGKHPDTEGHPARVLGVQMMLAGHLDTPARMREWIEGIR